MMTAMCLRLNSFPSLDSFRVYGNEDDATKDLAEFSLTNATYAALPSKVTLVNRVLGTTVRNSLLLSSLLKPVLIQPDGHG